MTKNEIMSFINTHPIFALATIEEDHPRVRFMMTAFADERGIIFSTGKGKDVYHQMRRNPQVECCYMDPQKQIQVRISARAREVDDRELKEAIVAKFDFLKPWVEQVGYDGMAAFVLDKASACVWTMQTNNEDKSYVPL